MTKGVGGSFSVMLPGNEMPEINSLKQTNDTQVLFIITVPTLNNQADPRSALGFRNSEFTIMICYIIYLQISNSLLALKTILIHMPPLLCTFTFNPFIMLIFVLNFNFL